MITNSVLLKNFIIAYNFLSKEYHIKQMHFLFQAQYIGHIYSTNKYNLSLADKYLLSVSKNGPVLQTNIHIDDLQILQEIAFVQNKGSIENYLEMKKQEEEKEMQFLRVSCNALINIFLITIFFSLFILN